jgi:hypothetical protein
MSDPEVQRSLGRLEEAVATLQKQQNSMQEKLDSVVTLANQASGGLKTLAAVGGIAGTIGGALGALVMKLKGGA